MTSPDGQPQYPGAAEPAQPLPAVHEPAPGYPNVTEVSAVAYQPPTGYPQSPQAMPYPPVAAYPPAVQSSSLYTAAAIINWVVLGLTVASTLGLGIIVAAWMIPMTVMIQKAAKDGYKHTGLAVCTLLFCGVISGILMLVDEGNRQPRPLR